MSDTSVPQATLRSLRKMHHVRRCICFAFRYYPIAGKAL